MEIANKIQTHGLWDTCISQGACVPCLSQSSTVLPVRSAHVMLHLRVITRCGYQAWYTWQHQLYMSSSCLRHSLIQRPWNAVLASYWKTTYKYTCPITREHREGYAPAECLWLLESQGNEDTVSYESLGSAELHGQFITAGKWAERRGKALPRNQTHNGRIHTAHICPEHSISYITPQKHMPCKPSVSEELTSRGWLKMWPPVLSGHTWNDSSGHIKNDKTFISWQNNCAILENGFPSLT